MRKEYWIAIAVVALVVIVVAYLRSGNSSQPKYELELSSQLDSLKLENARLQEVTDSLSAKVSAMETAVLRATSEAKEASLLLHNKRKENQSLMDSNKKKRDENNTRINNSTSDQLTKDILAEYGHDSERCCG